MLYRHSYEPPSTPKGGTFERSAHLTDEHFHEPTAPFPFSCTHSQRLQQRHREAGAYRRGSVTELQDHESVCARSLSLRCRAQSPVFSHWAAKAVSSRSTGSSARATGRPQFIAVFPISRTLPIPWNRQVHPVTWQHLP